MASRFAWCTDVHLDHIDNDPNKIVAFIDDIKRRNPDGVFITGDISSSQLLNKHLGMIENVGCPVYFVLGNHDFWGSSIERVRADMHAISNASERLRYMGNVQYIGLSNDTAVVGADGWYDCLYGDYRRSNFLMNDWEYIADYCRPGGGGGRGALKWKTHNIKEIVETSQQIAVQSVNHMFEGIKSAVKYYKNIVVLTHVPPFEEAHIFQGQRGTPEAQPWFASKLMGDMLLNAARTFQNVNFTVLAGHTHGHFDGMITSNMSCKVGGAEYLDPKVQCVIEVP